jgi:uncharacterized surface protein with fasciclin (FAS1) repeats
MTRFSPKLIAATLGAATFAFAAPALAGDCNYKKTSAATSATIQTTAANQTDVMGATIHTVGQYNSSSMKAEGTIVDAAVATPDLSTLVAAVQAAGLVDTLAGDGPFTVFAPTNAAFDALPDGTVASLLQPENKAALTRILTSHVVAGNLSSADIIALAQANGGKVEVQTLSGATLKAKLWDGNLYVKDESGNKASVLTADVMKGNGTVHIVTSVLLPGDGGDS